MQLGLALPQYDLSVPGERPLRWETLVAHATTAERLGYDSVWLSDHLFLDFERFGGGAGRQGVYEPIVSLAALARLTHRVRLGTLTICEALRPPGVLAKALASLDSVAGGRLDITLGAGWFDQEYEAIGLALPPPGVRLARLAETIDILRGMLGGGPFSYSGRHHTVTDAPNRPAMHRPAPLAVGGRGDRLLRLVAERADGWNAVWAWTPTRYRARLDVLDRACGAVGRDPATVERTLGLAALVGEDRRDLERRWARLVDRAPNHLLDGVALETWAEGRLVGTVEEAAAQLDVWRTLGVSTLIVGPGPLPFCVSSLDDLEPMIAAARMSGMALRHAADP